MTARGRFSQVTETLDGKPPEGTPLRLLGFWMVAKATVMQGQSIKNSEARSNTERDYIKPVNL